MSTGDPFCDICGEDTGDDGACGPCVNCGMPLCVHHEGAGGPGVDCPLIDRADERGIEMARAKRARAYWTPVRVAETIARGKIEILADIASGRVPADVSTFAALHDYVDANEYGGLCEKPVDPSFAPGNEIQNALDAWLARGRQEIN
jgi:hypothetical protein